MELDVSEVRHKAQTAVVVSHSSIVIPYFLGVTLALFPRHYGDDESSGRPFSEIV